MPQSVEVVLTEKYVSALEAKELERATSYTLADAMREGAGVVPQKVGGWYDSESTCALSAAYFAAKARGWL